MIKERYKLARAKVAPLPAENLKIMLDSESTLARHYPCAFEILTNLTGAGIRISEFTKVQHGVSFGVLGGVVIVIYNSEKVVVQGDVYEHGATGKRLKGLLPKTTIWQR